MSKDDVKKIFFELLAEDEEFRRKLTEFILNAVAEKFVERVAKEEEPPQVEVAEPEAEQKNSTEEFAENVAKLIEECDEAQSQFEKIRGEKNSVEGERNRLQSELENLRGEKNSVEVEHNRLQSELEKIRGEKNSVEVERNRLQSELENLRGEKNSVESERNRLQSELENLRGEKNSVENERNRLQSELENLRREKNSVESERDEAKRQLDERFSEGWEVYKKFLRIDADARKESGIYSEDFVSFICSGAQMKRLESIWEAALDCKRNKNFNDAEIFFEVFKYCVRLVNAAQGDKVIELLNTQLGDRYDTDKHSTGGTNSAAQGVVREIILVGYRNNISKKTIKKSNVRVG